MSGDRKEQYQNLRNLSLAPKTKELYAQIIFAYINGAADFFTDLSGLCSSLERRNAHLDAKEYSDYEFIASVRHANHLNRYDEYVNELGWCLKKIGCTSFGMKEEDFEALKSEVLTQIVRNQNPDTLKEAMKRLNMTFLPGLDEAELANKGKQTESDMLFNLFYATPNDQTLNLMLGMYDGAVLQAMSTYSQLQDIDISDLDFHDSRIDEIIIASINAAETRAKARMLKELVIHKFGLQVVDSYIKKIEEQHKSGAVGIFR